MRFGGFDAGLPIANGTATLVLPPSRLRTMVCDTPVNIQTAPVSPWSYSHGRRWWSPGDSRQMSGPDDPRARGRAAHGRTASTRRPTLSP
eukprot:scaffold360_cov334-Prasinococcus_capsulatus_cf.AAC.16